MAAVSAQREFAVQVVNRLREAGHIALFAGGCVRDLLLGRQSNDFDVATTATPDDVRTLFGHRRTLAVGASFGVIVVIGPPEIGHVEVATFRTDIDYVDGRRPERIAFCSPEEDARRRDFTINGMFFDPIDERVIDYVGGEADLRARLVRAIGDPHDRMREDKLRMLRAVRFTSILDFTLDPITADAVRQMSSELIVVSAERIAQELKKMLLDRSRRRAIELASDMQILRIILPELDALQKQSDWMITLKRLEVLEQPAFELAMAALLKSLESKSIVNKICRRLKLSNDECDRICWLVEHQRDLDDAPTLSLALLKRRLAHPYRDDLLALMQADRTATGSDQASHDFCCEYLRQTPYEVLDPVPLVTGDDLVAMGLRPGPRFKQVLETIRDAQLNLELADRDEAMKRARVEWGS